MINFFKNRRIHTGKRLVQLSLLLLLTVMTVLAYAGYVANTEHKLKVAMIYKLTMFVEWPVETIEKYNDFSICMIGENSFGSIIDVLQKRKVENKQITIRQILSTDVIDDECKLAYINVSKKTEFESILKKLQSRSVLTISDHEQFVELGGMVQLILKSGRMSFSINYDSAVKAGLSISASLLELAHEVKINNSIKSK